MEIGYHGQGPMQGVFVPKDEALDYALERCGGRNACCLPRCLRGLKYKGRSEKDVQLLQCSDLPQNKAIY